MRQIVHWFSGDNNLIPFHLRWIEIVLKHEKFYKCFVQDCRNNHPRGVPLEFSMQVKVISKFEAVSKGLTNLEIT